MCSEHNTFVWIVDRRNLITVGRVWSSWRSHTACLASADCPHEASGLIDSSRMLARCRALSTVDADRTPSIDVCQFFRYSRLSANILERMLKIFLKFGGLTTLVAHLLTSRTPGWNPEELTEILRTLFLSFSLFFSQKDIDLHHAHKDSSRPDFLSKIFLAHAPLFSSF